MNRFMQSCDTNAAVTASRRRFPPLYYPKYIIPSQISRTLQCRIYLINAKFVNFLIKTALYIYKKASRREKEMKNVKQIRDTQLSKYA